MRERPILFNDAMVRAILDGRKTQTRRLVEGANGAFWDHGAWRPVCEGGRIVRWATADGDECGPGAPAPACPYGAPGDLLWVREAWRVSSSGRHYPSRWTTVYVEWREQQKVRGRERGRQHRSEWFCTDDEHDALMRRAYGNHRSATWRPSVHMPRWASRITLEVTGVRVERLQDITEEDARAEGIRRHAMGWSDGSTGYDVMTARDAFGELWADLYGDESWERNDWVWVCEFKLLEVKR